MIQDTGCTILSRVSSCILYLVSCIVQAMPYSLLLRTSNTKEY